MKIILEMEEFAEAKELTQLEKSRIESWIKKYERYFNPNDDNFLDSIDSLVDDCISNLKIGEGKGLAVKKMIEDLYELTDDFSVIMSPKAEFNFNDIDQVQRFQY